MKAVAVTETKMVPETVMVEKEIKTGEVTLTLTAREASDLRTITAHISGSPENTPRGTASSIYEALKHLGVAATPVNPAQSMQFPLSWQC
jgi:hypothetical protein